MTAICEGALGNFDNLIEYKDEICSLLRRPGQKVSEMAFAHPANTDVSNFLLQQTQILTLLESRVHKFPSDYIESSVDVYWKYLCYEMLYLWGVFSSIKSAQLADVIEGKLRICMNRR